MTKSKLSHRYQPAFTIVELLIVIIVIAVLAMIVIVAYNGIQNRANIASLTSNLVGASKILSADGLVNGTYPATLVDANNGQGISPGPDTTYDYYPTTTGFCLTATKNSVSYRISNNGEPKPSACSGGTGTDATSLIKWSTWTVGSGGTATYPINGDGNSRITDTNPWGVTDVVWDVSDQDALSDADGGWNGGTFAIDNSKKYRFSTFVRRKNNGNGNFYLGTHGYPDPVLNRSNAVANANPYFYAAGWWGAVNQWYLVLGYIWPAGSGTGASTPDGGLYTMSGSKLGAGTDYTWQPTTTSSNHRAYMYYATDVTTNQQFYQPRVDVIDGTEPTISELLNNAY